MIKLETLINDMPFSLETGRLAKQANGAVVASYGDSIVLVSAVASKDIKEGVDFLPLLVDYQEMFYAAGRIPGGYFKREIGRPSEREVLTCRLIDRPLRPRFPDGYRHDTQIIATVLSADPEVDTDVIAITGASAALSVSNIPFDGPIAGVRVGRIDGEFVVNPARSQLALSDMNIIVAGSRDAIVMVEGGAALLPEKDVSDAIFFAHDALQPLIDLQEELMAKAGKEKFSVTPPEPNPELLERVTGLAQDRLSQVIKEPDKMKRGDAKAQIKKEVKEALMEDFPDMEKEVAGILKEMEKDLLRSLIINEKKRMDGRSFSEVRPITCSVGELPRAHGSAVFTRGETQVLAVATLGSAEDEQRIEMPLGEVFKNFLLHYNFPPFCVGEVRPMRGPARRDIGHGALAERALASVVPDLEDFSYTIRVVSDVMESNGSSSMATVCGGTLSMMDAGIPIRDMVAGVAMGLIKDGDDFIILTDILGDEDHLGDMDFKVAGTDEGVSALQMDIKISGINKEVLGMALVQAKEARNHILGKMREVLTAPREELPPHAPRITTIHIKTDRIRDLIGPGGKNIRSIVAACEVKIDVDDSGKVNIFSSSEEATQKAIKMIKEMTKEVEIGKIYMSKVKKIVDFGAFVEIFPGVEGLVHISQLENYRVENVRDVLHEGDEFPVKVLEINDQGKIRLSRKAAFGEKVSE
jgi:polyribonucleotide nucleotidyltransferase